MVCKKKIMFALLFVFLLNPSLQSASSNIDLSKSTFANLVIHATGGSELYDYAVLIAQDLQEIGINVEIKTEVISIFPGIPSFPNDYDMKITEFEGDGASPDMREYYTEDGDLNVFLLGPDLPYGNQSEIMQDVGVTITDIEARRQHYYDWQQLMMDRIVPMLPLYSPNSYTGTWSNTEGYDAKWGLIDSLPYMSYDGYHEGQVSLDEINLVDANWRELNPLFTDYTSSEFIWELISEQLLHFGPDFYPMNTGLLQGWTKIDDFHYKFLLRDNVYWNPSYNVTGRTASSIPLNNITDEELMVGLKNWEFSNGTNQKVTAKDAVFTLLCWANPVISEYTGNHEWISDCYVDPIDPLSFHIHIDGNPDTPQIEHYVDFWSRLTDELLPEFFLNSTSTEITYTTSGIECRGLFYSIGRNPQWVWYSTSAFGCGKYMLDYAIDNSVTVLQRSPYWFGVGTIDGQEGLEPFVETINIRVIPDTSAELAEFKAGKLDFTYLTAFPSTRQILETDPRFTIYQTLTNSLTFMYFNLRRPFIGGVANFEYIEREGKENYTIGAGIRKAICYAINRDEMNEVLHDGEYIVAHSVLYPYSSYYYYEDVIKYNYNPALAEQWIRDSFGIAEYSINILNIADIYSDIVFKFSVVDSLSVTKATLYYDINNEGYNSSEMFQLTPTTYSLNIGSGFTNGTIIKYYVEYKNSYGDTRKTDTRIFEVDYDNMLDLYITIDAPSIIILFVSISVIYLINCTFQKEKRKKIKL